MNILLLCNKLPYPPKDGGSIATLNLAKGFVLAGNHVEILAINTSKHFTPLDKIPAKLSTQITFHAVDVNTDLKPHKALSNLLFSIKPYNAVRFFSKVFDKLLVDILKKGSFNIIQLEGLYMTQYINTIRKNSDAIISFRAHNIEHEIWQRTAKQMRNGLKKIYLNILTRRIRNLEVNIINNYDLLIPITGREEEIFNKLGNIKPVYVSQTGINTNEINPGNIKPEYPSVFHIGALDWGPNQEGIIWFIKNIWPKILKNYPTLKFYIAGRNAPEWFIKSASGKNILFLGEVDDAYDFMQKKAIMIVPLLSGSGMRIKIIEGMALGKTIVSTSIGSEGINSTHKKNILIANTIEEFLSELEKLLSDQKMFNNIGENAVKFIMENFDNFVLSENLVDFYKSQINR